MPCFLFTYHAYGSWLPDRDDGYVHWREGLQKRDDSLATAYKRKMKVAGTSAVVFDDAIQRWLIDELRTASKFQRFRLHAAATEDTHVHAITSWGDERTPLLQSKQIKKSLSLRLTMEASKQKWLAKGGNERRVKDQEHLTW